MKFIDEATITVQSGNGGRGCVSFRREKYIPRGGPDGGDGGKGGDVILKVVSQKRTLYHFHFKKHCNARNGGHGQGNQRTGKNGSDLILEVPPGTEVYNSHTGELIKDLTDPGDSFVIAKGGRGGQGNKRFATSTNRAPRFAQPGEPGETFSLRLELKLLADVGIIGLPNAGKSTLIRAITAANPKIASYPFTTLSPNLGVVKAGDSEPIVLADIPGLIEGAHRGAGLGIQFLKHIERTRILIHIIDAASLDTENPLYSYETVNREMGLYNENLLKKRQIVVLNKMDMTEAQERAEKFQSAYRGGDVICISAAAGIGIPKLIDRIVSTHNKPDED